MKTRRLLKSVVVSCVSILVAFLLAEVLLRVILFTRWLPIAGLMSPDLYAGSSDDDDYWRLHHRLSGQWYPRKEVVHPVLGWSQSSVTADDPWGLEQASLNDVRKTTRKRRIPFYGDSFVKGASDPEHYIPVFTTKLLQETKVVDLAVGGFGFDQIYLMYEQTRDAFPYTDVLVGVLTEDLDRSILSTRSYQKPFFRIESGELKLDATPIDPDPAHYLKESTPHIRSYLLAYLRRRWARTHPEFARKLGRIAEKKEINGKILDKFLEGTRSRGAKLLFVLFYQEPDLRKESWEERFLKESLAQRGIPFLDTKPVLLEYVETQHLDVSDLYQEHGHHNNLGNEVIAKALHALLLDQGYR